MQRHVIETFLASRSQRREFCRAARRSSTKRCLAALRRNTVWTLARIDDPRATVDGRDFFDDPDETVRQAAIHVTAFGATRPRRGLIELLLRSPVRLRTAAPRPRRLGDIGDKSAVPALLQAAGEADDRILEHSITYALIEIGDAKATRPGCRARTRERSGPPWSLSTRWTAAVLTRNSCRGTAGLGGAGPQGNGGRGSSAGIPDWADALAGVFGERLGQIDLPARGSDRARTPARPVCRRRSPIQRLLAARLRDAFAPVAARRSSLQAMAWSNLKAEAVPRDVG